MSMMYCDHCDKQVDTDKMDHCQFEPEFMCEDCMDRDPTPDVEGEPPITWLERAKQVRPR